MSNKAVEQKEYSVIVIFNIHFIQALKFSLEVLILYL
jgi:hypothetical protein